MHKLYSQIIVAALLFFAIAPTHAKDTPSAEDVKALTTKVADWQISTFDDHGSYRALPSEGTRKHWQNNENYHDLVWHMGALYAGMNEFRKIADDPEKYTEWLIMIGERNDWQLHKRPYHADDHAVGQFYLSLYQDFKDPKMLEPTQKHFDWILANPKTGSLEWKKGTDRHDRWGWCDALFMAPPVWARLAKITGEDKYLEFMDQEYHATYDYLWSEEDHFFFRDSSFFEKTENNGESIYWARGNGWVFGGLALMIPDLPEDWAGREFYVEVYKKMAESLKDAQRADGTWSMGILGDLKSYPKIETTGTSFFTFGFAWGINNGILDPTIYRPVVLNAWEALEKAVTPEGMLGYVQPVGAAPGESIADATEVYAIGAFLAAGSEVYKLLADSSAGVSQNASDGAETFARYVPERKDDFAWENDVIAFRAYGPALRKGKENNGIDCWLKRVRYPIIDKWYREAEQGKSYHKDHGEGLDNYHVGSSAGCGGTGIWLDGQREPLETYTEYEIIEVTPERSRFKLTYEREIDGITYGEEKTITIELGKPLFQADSVFTKNGQPAADLPVCIGLTTHDGKADSFSDPEAGWISTWEKLDDSELGTAARIDPARLVSVETVQSKKKDESHIFIVTKTGADGRIRYEAGYGWKKAGMIQSPKQWSEYLSHIK